jgi:spermidine synthase
MAVSPRAGVPRASLCSVEHEVVARAESERGEVVVRRRTDDQGEDVLELRVNGVFVMDTAETGTERRLARATLAAVAFPRRILVGGLGLGFTLAELLDDPRVERVLVAEIEHAVVEWMRAGVLPGAEQLADPRVHVAVGDVRDLAADLGEGAYDVILLDVDNGPDFLVHEANAALYEPDFLARCRHLLAPEGALAVWSSTESPSLEAAMRGAFGGCHVVPLAVDLQGRDERYWLFTSKTVP